MRVARLVILLLRSGADPNIQAVTRNATGEFQFEEVERKYPLTLLLRSHSTHHSPMDTVPNACSMDLFLSVVDIVAECMCTDVLQRVFYQYVDVGVYGVFCDNQCPLFQRLYAKTTEPRKLLLICRQVIWKSSGYRLNTRCDELPLPTNVKKFIKWSWNYTVKLMQMCIYSVKNCLISFMWGYISPMGHSDK